MQLVLITIICLGAAVAAPQRPGTDTKDTPEEMVIRLVLHVKRSDDGTQLVVDLVKSQESSEVVRPMTKPIASLSTILPIFAKSDSQKNANSSKLLAEKSYEIPERKEPTESNPYVVFSQTKRSIAADTSDRAVANGYINLRPQNSGTTPYYHSSSKDEQSKPKDRDFVTPRVTSRPKLDFKITLGGPTTERPHKFSPPKPILPIRGPPTTEAVRTRPPMYYHYVEVKTTETAKPEMYHNSDKKNTTESQEEMPEIELIDKAVADQGFGVLASRCESFAPGLVSDGAGGCTRPIARPKNKNYQGTYAYRSAAGNELHADVKDTPEDADNSTETTQIRVV